MRGFGLIGYPLVHSFSPGYFEEKFQRENISDAYYKAFPLASTDGFHTLLHQHSELSGLNVTIPYKKAVIPFLDYIDDDAKSIGAVNCIRIIPAEKLSKRQTDEYFEGKAPQFRNQYLLGFNTDAPAFAESLSDEWNLPSKALVFGTGGAAKAVIFSLKKLKIDFIQVSRKPVNNDALQYEMIPESVFQNHKLWINTTPVGMWPKTDETLPLPFHLLDNNYFLFDLIYNPLETKLLKEGNFRSAHTKNGLTMLHSQADKSWAIFNASAEALLP